MKDSLVGHLDTSDLGSFLEHLDQLTMDAGTQILAEGDEGDAMFFILEGRAAVGRGDFLIRTLEQGDHFGEIALLGMRRRAASVVTLTHARFARLSRARYQSLAKNHPRVALHLLQAIVAS